MMDSDDSWCPEGIAGHTQCASEVSGLRGHVERGSETESSDDERVLVIGKQLKN